MFEQGLTPEQQALNDLKWSYAEGAIELDFTVVPDLNQYDGQAHSLLVVVAQLEQNNVFANSVGSSQQLSNLLLSESAPEGMVGLTRVFLQPGENQRITLPRLEGTRMVGIAAGYAHLDPARSAKLYQIGVDVTSSGFFSRTWQASPQPIAIDLWVGADGLLRGSQSGLSAPTPIQPREGEVRLSGEGQ